MIAHDIVFAPALTTANDCRGVTSCVGFDKIWFFCSAGCVSCELSQRMTANASSCQRYGLERTCFTSRVGRLSKLVILVDLALKNDSLTLPGLLFYFMTIVSYRFIRLFERLILSIECSCLTSQIMMIFISKPRTSRVQVRSRGLFACVNRPKREPSRPLAGDNKCLTASSGLVFHREPRPNEPSSHSLTWQRRLAIDISAAYFENDERK